MSRRCLGFLPVAVTALLFGASVFVAACSSNGSSSTNRNVVTTTSGGGATTATQSVAPVADGGAIDLSTQLTLADVAILLPLASSATEAEEGYLAASAIGDRGTLLPSSVAPALAGLANGNANGNGHGPTTTTTASYTSLRVMALRVDPCFAALDPSSAGSACVNQLRLVFQVLAADGSSAADSAAHAFYALTRDELLSLTRSLVALRLEQSAGDDVVDLGALAPHAIVARQGLGGAMAAGLRAIVLHYAGATNLTRVTHFNVAGANDQWTFGGVDLAGVTDTSAGTSTPMVIPTADDATTQTFRSQPGHPIIDGTATPSTTSADDLMPLASATEAASLSSAARQTAFDGLLRVENPSFNSPNTVDCVSCHLATPVRTLVAQPLYKLSESGDASAFVPDPALVPPADAVATVDATQVNVHAFSYAGTHPAVSQRTVNEAAAIVQYLVAHPD